MFSYNTIEEFRQKIFLVILGLMVCGTAIATWLHYSDMQTEHPLDLIVPPIAFVISLVLFVYLILNPDRLPQVIQLTIALAVLSILVPIYFFVFEVLLFREKRLIDILPPLSSGPFLLTTVMIVFLRPRDSIRKALWLWGVLAIPILVYLCFHPDELNSPRGRDWFMTLFPMMAVNSCLVFYYSQIQDRLDRLQIERLRFKVSSETDALTGVYNRGAGEALLQELINIPNSQVGIIMFDIDRFKKVNDTYGHLKGDEVLRAVVERCKKNLRAKDTLVRWGGEEFVVIVKGDSVQELQFQAERIRKSFESEPMCDIGVITSSFGIAQNQPDEDASALFARADAALYQAKEKGRNRVEIAERSSSTTLQSENEKIL